MEVSFVCSGLIQCWWFANSGLHKHFRKIDTPMHAPLSSNFINARQHFATLYTHPPRLRERGSFNHEAQYLVSRERVTEVVRGTSRTERPSSRPTMYLRRTVQAELTFYRSTMTADYEFVRFNPSLQRDICFYVEQAPHGESP